MLILSRKPGQRIIINGNIFIEISSIDFNTARLAIDAPSEVSIDREEVHKLKLKAKREVMKL